MADVDPSTLAARATHPGTPLQELAQLAYDYPHLRPLVAANPSAYEGLLQWLGQLGDPAVDAVLQARGVGQASAAPAGVAPANAAPASMAPATGVPADATPATAAPAGMVQAPAKGHGRRWAIIGVAAAVVLALVVAGAIVIPRAGARGGPQAGIPRVHAYPQGPHATWTMSADKWGLEPDSLTSFTFRYFAMTPSLIAAGKEWVVPYNGPGGLLGIDPATGLIDWDSADTLSDSLIGCAEQLYKGSLLCLLGDDFGGSRQMAQIDPATGKKQATWQLDFDAASVTVEGSTVYLQGTGSDISTMVVARLSGPGKTVWSQRYRLSNMEQDTLNHGYGYIKSLGGLVVASLDGVQKVIDASDGTLLDSPTDSWVRLCGNDLYAITVGQDAYETTTQMFRKGSTVPVWDAPGALPPQTAPTGQQVYLINADGAVSAHDMATGVTHWTKYLDTTDGQIIYWDANTVIASASSELVAFRASDGKELWRNSRDFEHSPSDVHTDGQRLFATDGPDVVAITISDGTVAWRWGDMGNMGDYATLAHAGDTLLYYDSDYRLTSLT